MGDVPLWRAVAGAAATAAVSFVAGRFTMTRKEAKDVQQKNYENSVKLAELRGAAYGRYRQSMSAYISGTPGDEQLFHAWLEAGDAYFANIGLMCDSVLSEKVDEAIRDNTWLPHIRSCFERTLPRHYEVVKNQAVKHNFPYSGRLRRQDHESIYAVVEKLSGTMAWEKALREEDQ